MLLYELISEKLNKIAYTDFILGKLYNNLAKHVSYSDFSEKLPQTLLEKMIFLQGNKPKLSEGACHPTRDV